jgi:superfamily II DNA or RNA helicase
LLRKNKYDIKVSDEVKTLYGNNIDNVEFIYNLKYSPRYYQEEITNECIRYKKGIFVSPTASGKSLIISYIIDILHHNKLSNKSLIIVPTTSLVVQFYEDLLEYGISSNLIGKFYAEEKD